MDQAMVQIVENHAEIAGRLLDVAPSADRPGFVILRIEVRETHEIEDWPNLFTNDIGKTIEVLAREGSEAAAAKPGPIRLKVKKGGPTTVFAE
jgi:hypothetical protein